MCKLKFANASCVYLVLYESIIFISMIRENYQGLIIEFENRYTKVDFVHTTLVSKVCVCVCVCSVFLDHFIHSMFQDPGLKHNSHSKSYVDDIATIKKFRVFRCESFVEIESFTACRPSMDQLSYVP